MENRENVFTIIQTLRTDCAKKQKRGIHFIISSIIIWIAILIIHNSSLLIQTKNLYTFFCSTPLLVLSYLVSKLIKVDFQNKNNPLTNLGILFSMNQMLYILIAMWIYASVPDKMLMIYAMIFGAHLLPYGWLYQSKTYYVLSILIPIIALLIGLNFSTVILAAVMLFIEIVFLICLCIENRNIKSNQVSYSS